MSDSFIIKDGVLTDYKGSEKCVTVPSEITVIGSEAFRGNKRLKEVRFEGRVIIGDLAFEKCTALEKITFCVKPDKLKQRAFAGCRSLREINGLDDCDMPFISANTFAGCGRDNGRGLYLIGTRLFNTDEIRYSREYSFPADVSITAVMPRALKNIKAERIIIPDGVKYIGSSITDYSLKSIVLPDSLEYISVKAFCDSYEAFVERCSDKVFALLAPQDKMRCIMNSDGWGEPFGKNAAAFVKPNANTLMHHFVRTGNAAGLADVMEFSKPGIELALELMEEAAEYENPEVNALLLSYIQTSFSAEDIAAADEKETEIALGLREKSVAEWRKQFKFKYIDGGILITDIVKPCAKIFIPEKIGKKKVVKLQFYKLEGVETVHVPGTVKTVDCGSFVACADLKTVYISYGIEKLESGAFMFCSKINWVYIPSSVKTIDKEAFDAASILKNIPFNLPIFSKPKITVITEHGSCAERFANENGYHIEYIK